MSPTVLVTLATGQQGRATVAALLDRGAKVHAVVRDPTKDTARELERQGVVLFKGTNDDFDVFRTAAEGCQALFLNLVSWPDEPHSGRQAAGIIKAVREAGVEHVVLSTAGCAPQKEKWHNLDRKDGFLMNFFQDEVMVEDAVRQSGVASHTIIRPFWFHSNYLPPMQQAMYPELGETGTLVHSFKSSAVFPHVHVSDIGRFAAMALLDPARFGGLEIEFASENLTIDDVADAIRKATGRKIELRSRDAEQNDPANPNVAWQLMASDSDLSIDVDDIKRRFDFHFTTLEEYFSQNKDQLLASIGGSR